jgi:hypothetical protein
MSWWKTALDVAKTSVDVIKLLLPKRPKPGPDVKPIGPDDLKR